MRKGASIFFFLVVALASTFLYDSRRESPNSAPTSQRIQTDDGEATANAFIRSADEIDDWITIPPWNPPQHIPDPPSASRSFASPLDKYDWHVLGEDLVHHFPWFLVQRFYSFSREETAYLSSRMPVNTGTATEQQQLSNRLRARGYAASARRIVTMIQLLATTDVGRKELAQLHGKSFAHVLQCFIAELQTRTSPRLANATQQCEPTIAHCTTLFKSLSLGRWVTLVTSIVDPLIKGQARYFHSRDEVFLQSVYHGETSDSGGAFGDNLRCDDAASREGRWKQEELLVALLADLENLLDLWNSLRGSSLESICVEYRPTLRAAVLFHRSNRWMFFPHSRPAAVESDIEDRYTHSGEDLSEHHFSHRYEGISRRGSANSQTRMGKTLHHLRNVCIPSVPGRSGPPTGYGLASPLYLKGTRDERWIVIRRLGVQSRKKRPRFFLRNRQLWIQPMLFASENIGHVLFRHFSAQLLQNESGLDPSRDLFSIYMALPSSLLTFGPNNMYRAFVDRLGAPWGGILASSDSFSHSEGLSGDFDLCFSKGIVGTGYAPMYHPSATTSLALPSAVKDGLKKLGVVIASVRQRLAQCCKINDPGNDKTRKIRVVAIERSNRRVLHMHRLVEAIKTKFVFRSPLHLELVDFANFPIREQFIIAQRADVLMGPRGAAHSWGFALKPRSVVVEFSYKPHICGPFGIDRAGKYPTCEFEKLAILSGVHYFVWRARSASSCSDLHRCDMQVSEQEFSYVLERSLCIRGRELFAQDCPVEKGNFSLQISLT